MLCHGMGCKLAAHPENNKVISLQFSTNVWEEGKTDTHGWKLAVWKYIVPKIQHFLFILYSAFQKLKNNIGDFFIFVFII